MLCKLTTQDMTTHNGCEWTVGEWKETDGSGDMCGPGWLHCCDDPLLAVLHNPIHAGIDNPMLWEIEVGGEKKTDGLKSAYTRMRIVKAMPLPEITTMQKIAYAILCAKEVCADKAWNAWADAWLSGKDRSKEAAEAAWAAAAAVAARAVAAARAAAVAAAWAAVAAADKKIDFIALARKAIEYKE
jgi:hypothetical protein